MMLIVGCRFVGSSMALWEPGYDIFVLWFRPKTSNFSCLTNALAPPPIAPESCLWLRRIGQPSRLHSKKNFWLGVRIFCEWRHKWSSFRVILAHVDRPRAQLLGQSFSLKFSLETRLVSESFEPLIDFLTILVQKLWSNINKLINYLISYLV